MDDKTKLPITTRKLLIVVAVIIAGSVSLFFLSSTPPGEPLNPEIYDGSGADLVALWSQHGIKCVSADTIENHGPAGSFGIQIISINGANERVPANIGVLENCFAEIYTIDTTRTVYLYPTRRGKELTLGDLFVVWGKNLERPGERVRVNGVFVEDPAGVVLEDGKRILLEYQRK